MNLSQAEVVTLGQIGDTFIEDGSYLLEETGECDLMRRVLAENPELEHEFPYLAYFLVHGEPPRAKRMTIKELRERNKNSKTMRVSDKTTGAKKPKKKAIKKPKKRTVKKGLRKPPQKTCPECKDKVHARKKACPCGHEF